MEITWLACQNKSKFATVLQIQFPPIIGGAIFTNMCKKPWVFHRLCTWKVKGSAPALHDTIRWLLTGKLIPKKRFLNLATASKRPNHQRSSKSNPQKISNVCSAFSSKHLVKKIGVQPGVGKDFKKKTIFQA